MIEAYHYRILEHFDNLLALMTFSTMSLNNNDSLILLLFTLSVVVSMHSILFKKSITFRHGEIAIATF